MRGTSIAPSLIRKAYHSASTNYYAEESIEISPDLLVDKGDFDIKEFFEIEEITSENSKLGLPIVTLGGDHSITYPIVKALHKIHGQFSILHIDAHSDLYPDFEGDPYSHACPFYHIMKEGLCTHLAQVGIRTLNDVQRKNAVNFKVNVVEMKDIEHFKMPQLKGPIYLSVDIDALDPAFAPGVSHHEPGGLSTRQILSIIQHIKVPLLGADIVEYNPKNDINGMTAMVCGKLFKEIAAKMLI